MNTTIDVSTILIGSQAPTDYYSAKGELLIGKGTIVTQNHLEMFHRRNIFDVIVKQHTNEIQSIINRDFNKPDELMFDDDLANTPQKAKNGTIDLNRVPRGKQGLDELGHSPLALELDLQLQSNRVSDTPQGTPLRDRSTIKQPGERTEEYKNQITAMYNRFLVETGWTLSAIAQGDKNAAKNVKPLVEQLMQVYLYDRNILLCLSAIKMPELDYLVSHALNVCLLSINIGAAMGYSEQQVLDIGIGALLHDVGMLKVPTTIRSKTSRLSDEEWFEVQKHPGIGLHLLEKSYGLPDAVLFAAYQSHERENGTGYPKQRKKRLIHQFAKIVQVADIYEAMTTPRTYRKAWLPHEATAGLVKMTRTEMLDGAFVKAFLEYASLFPVGSLVELNDHRIGRVIQGNGISFAKPMVSVLTDYNNTPLPHHLIKQIDLCATPQIQILRAFAAGPVRNFKLFDGF